MHRNVRIRGADRNANQNGLHVGLQASSVQGRLYNLTVRNTGANTYYLQVFDSAAVPAEGTVPKLEQKLLPDTTGAFDFATGRLCLNGIYICLSTTSGTKTLAGTSDDCIIDCDFSNDD